MNSLDIIVFDFETGGLDPEYHEAIQVAGKAYNARTLEPYPAEAGGEFSSLMRPLYPDRLQDRALEVNGITREMLFGDEKKGISPAPDQKIVWNSFVQWVNKFNRKRSKFGAPLAAGKNIRDFDLRFAATLCKLHCEKKEKTLLFNTRRQVELEDLLFMWFESSQELPNEKMDTLREYFGMSHEGAHSAIVDCRQTGDLIMRFLRLHRDLKSRKNKEGEPMIRFRGALSRV